MTQHKVIKRRYADLSFGQIHYREAGEGQAVLLLHQSPSSSKDYIDLMNKWSGDFRLIAPDNPGNGNSDPLQKENPTIEGYAKAIIEFMDVLGIESACAYGYHTGSCFAVAASAIHPERFNYVVGNGISILTDAELADILTNYSPELEINEDGSHLSWLWHRIHLQGKYFPWYSTRDEDKIDMPPYTAQKAHNMLKEFLAAGNNYIAPYNAAFAGDFVNNGYIPNEKATIFFMRPDPISFGYDRLPKEQHGMLVDTLGECLDYAYDKFLQYK